MVYTGECGAPTEAENVMLVTALGMASPVETSWCPYDCHVYRLTLTKKGQSMVNLGKNMEVQKAPYLAAQ